MGQSWAAIADELRHRVARGYVGDPDGSFGRAVEGIAAVASVIADGPLATALHGWTSMHDLFVEQTDRQHAERSARPSPHLRLSPLRSGAFEFRFFDATVPVGWRRFALPGREKPLQWHRIVTPDDAPARFERFLDQIGWMVRERPLRA